MRSYDKSKLNNWKAINSLQFCRSSHKYEPKKQNKNSGKFITYLQAIVKIGHSSCKAVSAQI